MKPLREALTLLAVLGPVAYLCLYWQSIPAILPTHFGFDGQPNAYSPKSFIWVLVAVSVGMYVFLTVIARYPRFFNLPKPVGDPDRPRLEALGVEMIGWLRLEIAWIFAFMLASTLRVAEHRSGGLGAGFILMGILTLLTVGFYLWRMKKPAQAI